MEEKIVHKFFDKVKNKFIKKKQISANNYEYAFSDEEIENINKENKQKIQELKQDIFSKKKDSYDSNRTDEVLSKVSNHIEVQIMDDENLPQDNDEKVIEDMGVDSIEEDALVVDEGQEEVSGSGEVVGPKNSFINLSSEHQSIVMDKWNEIKQAKIDRDIINGKDLLNHNYTITYADEANKFIQYIRKEYEVVICYLIGFNNEKQGIYDKTYFADNMDDEWKYLSNYIKVLEKIRNFKK